MASLDSVNMLHARKKLQLQRIEVANQLTFKIRDYPIGSR